MENEHDIRSASPRFQQPKHDLSNFSKLTQRFDDSHLWKDAEYSEVINLEEMIIPKKSLVEKIFDFLKSSWRPITWVILGIFIISGFDYLPGKILGIFLYFVLSVIIAKFIPAISPWKINPIDKFFYYNIVDYGTSQKISNWAFDVFNDFPFKSDRAALYSGELEQIQITPGNNVFIIMSTREGSSSQILYSAINEYASVLNSQSLKPILYNQARIKFKAIPRI